MTRRACADDGTVRFHWCGERDAMTIDIHVSPPAHWPLQPCMSTAFSSATPSLPSGSLSL
eukprot:1808659-Pleurochrysis_carterae.AAC.1